MGRQSTHGLPPLPSSPMSAFWHPFAEMSKVQHAPFIIDRGEGIYVYDESGRRYLDAAASLWYMNVGYGRTEIIDAMAEQMRKLPAFHAFIDYGTRPTIDLADRIASVSPDPDSKVFFGSGGSDAVDTAAKMTRRYFNAIGQPDRTVFISREWAYHGMHPYGTSLGGMEPNRTGYGGDLVSDIVIVPHDDAEAVEKAIDHAGAERIAGIFVEPVIGAGGVRPVEESYFGAVQELVRNAGGLYVSDEVITGFGRVGDWFAANKYGLEPDLITFAKGVTCGYAPLGGVIAVPEGRRPVLRHARAHVPPRLHLLGPHHGLCCRPGRDGHPGAGGTARPCRRSSKRSSIRRLLPLEELPVVDHVRRGVGALAAVQMAVGDDETLPYRAAAVLP